MEPKRIIYYEDELNDDFAKTNISQKHLGDDFKYIKRNVLWRFFSWLSYYMLAIPILSIYAKLAFGVKFKNRKAVKKLRKAGYVVYANHTHYIDAFVLQTAGIRPKRAYILSSPDATSIKGLKGFVQMLGSIPVPTSDAQYRDFLKAIEYRLNKKNAVIIYPEAHIWPYYTGVRPFLNSSFYYPVKNNVPAIAAVTTFRKPKKEGKRPKFTITFSEPFYPNNNIARKVAQQELRDEVYSYMVDVTSSKDNFKYYEYIKKGTVKK